MQHLHGVQPFPNLGYHSCGKCRHLCIESWPRYIPQQSAAIDNGDDRRLGVLFVTQNLQFILQRRFTYCPHVSALSANRAVGCGTNSYEIIKAVCRYDLSQICHDPDDTCVYELSVYILVSNGVSTVVCQS